MRDIREDLRERLDILAAERAKLQMRVQAIELQEASYKAALREEEARVAQSSSENQTNPLPFPTASAVLLGPVIMRVMRAKGRPLALDEIRDEIVNSGMFDFGEKKPGRSVHFGLMSLQNGGELTRLVDGRWTLPQSASADPQVSSSTAMRGGQSVLGGLVEGRGA